MTVADAADLLATSPVQIMALIKRGELRAIQIGGRGQWRVEEVELNRYIDGAYARYESEHSTTDEREDVERD